MSAHRYGSGVAHSACVKRPKTLQNKMACPTSDTDEKDSELSSDDERGFFQMAESDEGRRKLQYCENILVEIL